MNRFIRATAATAAIVAMASACATTAQQPLRATSTMAQYDPGEWIYWGGDSGQTRYAPLNQINASNVDRLKIAWRWSADTSGGGASNNFKSTPFLIDGVLYTPWLENGMAAIDAGTGETLWTFVPPDVGLGGRGANLVPRSLAYWTDGNIKRLYHNSLDGRLIAVDAETGESASEFGTDGWIDLSKNLTEGREVTSVRSVSPALVVGDIVVVQVIPGGTRNKESTPGDIRGYDARTGELVWTFHVVPRPGEFGYETWEDGSAEYVGNTGVWTMMSADQERGIVYLPTDTPSNDFGGVERPGDGLFAESLVALDARTGERLWHFQMVHHGVWDYDMPAAPILHDIVRDGETIPVVTQLTKQSYMLVFNRVTGEPIWPIEERPVPTEGGAPGEQYSPTQPIPTWPEPLSNTGYNEDWLIDFTPELRAEAVEIMERYQKGPLYTPIAVATDDIVGTWIYPGFGGAPNWNGASVDPRTNIMYVPIRHRPSAVGVQPGDPDRTNLSYVQTNNHTVMGPDGMPILKPPYSELIAVDMNSGEQLWRVPIGGAPDEVRNHPDLQDLGLDFDSMGQFNIKPSPILTGDMIFMGESGSIGPGEGGPMFRAYDIADGDVLWEIEMPSLVSGAPMTYMHEGRQYIVVAVSNPGDPAEYIALTLDGVSENGAPPPGGVELAAMPVLNMGAAAEVEATEAELARGRAGYNESCAICHAEDGSGGIGPALIGFPDPAGIGVVIAEGQGEMQAMSSVLSAAEIQAISKYVAVSWGDT